MKKVPAGEFKTHCLSIMDQVHATGEPVLITKRGKAVVKVLPADPASDLFGFMAGEFKIVGDIEAPTIPASTWKVTKQ
jgi:prevent-host-death family protein